MLSAFSLAKLVLECRSLCCQTLLNGLAAARDGLLL
jgi:hypothetical protein